MVDITISANVVAWYGAIVATVSGLMGGYAIWRDRTKLKVSVSPSMNIMPLPSGSDPNAAFVVVKVANVGRRPIHLENAHFKPRTKGKKWLVVFTPWRPGPILNEGQSATTFVDRSELSLADMESIIVYDQAGRSWKARIPKERG